MHDPNVISDLTCALPRQAWTDADSHVHKPIAAKPAGGWRIIDYTTDRYAGRALMTCQRDAATLRIPLGRKGWHAVSLGLSERQWGQVLLQVRLSGDEHWQMIRVGGNDGGGPLREEPWCFADLTGRDLELRFPDSCIDLKHDYDFNIFDTVCSLYSIRCTPVAPAHVAQLQQADERPFVVVDDGFGLFYGASRSSPDIVSNHFSRFAGGDATDCCFGNIGGDLVNYPSNLGTLCGAAGWDFVRPGDKRVADILRELIEGGHDPMRIAADTVHAQDQDFWVYLRPQAHMCEPPYDHILRSEFFSKHPEWRCVEADGSPLSKLSFTFPQVREHLNGLVSEMMSREADGLLITFVRGYPIARYEPAVIDRVRELHNVDARTLPDTDARLHAVWAEFATAWLVELRRLLDDAGPTARRNRRRLGVMVGPDAAWNMQFGFDIRAWAKARLIDAVLPYPYRGDNKMNLPEFTDALKGTNVELWPSLGTFQQNVSLAVYRQRAHECYTGGATGLSRWDAPGFMSRLRFNRPAEQALWVEHYWPEQNVEMTSIAGQSLKSFGPMLGF